jgi:hypothetical protein
MQRMPESLFEKWTDLCKNKMQIHMPKIARCLYFPTCELYDSYSACNWDAHPASGAIVCHAVMSDGVTDARRQVWRNNRGVRHVLSDNPSKFDMSRRFWQT